MLARVKQEYLAPVNLKEKGEENIIKVSAVLEEDFKQQTSESTKRIQGCIFLVLCKHGRYKPQVLLAQDQPERRDNISETTKIQDESQLCQTSERGD